MAQLPQFINWLIGQPTVIDQTMTSSVAFYSLSSVVVQLSASGNIPIPVTLPAGITNYFPREMLICNASTDISASSISLYTGVNATGITVIGSTTVTVITSAISLNNNAMVLNPSVLSTQAINSSILYFTVNVGVGSAATAVVIVNISPAY